MLLIDKDNLPLVSKITSVRDVLRMNSDVILDLPYDEVNRLTRNGLPTYKVIRAWSGIGSRYVEDLGVDDLTYNELESVVLNPSISRLALEHHRFEQVLPKPLFDMAMAGLNYKQCVEYRLDIIDTLKVPSIEPSDKRRMIDDAFKTKLLPISSVDELEDMAPPAFSLDLASNLMQIKHDKLLVSIDLINKDVVRSAGMYNSLMMLLSAGVYDVTAIDKLMRLCDMYRKYDYIRNLPEIPTQAKTADWFEVCKRSPAAIKYVATNGRFNKRSLDEFIGIIEKDGVMADMVLLYENRRLSESQRSHVKVSIEPLIQAEDYRPALFDKYISDGTTYDVENFAITYKEFPSAMLLLQSPAALARTGIYYMYHLHDNLDFLLEYLVRTSEVPLSDKDNSKLLSVVLRADCDEAYILYLLSSEIPLDFKKQLVQNILQ